MSNWLNTYNVIIKNEAGYAPAFGASGETYKGIDRKFFPSWIGWKIVDAAKPLKRGAIINSAELEKDVEDFYFTYFSDLINTTLIINQTLADFTADFIFHKRYDAVKVINATARQLQPTIAIETTKVTDQVIGLMNANAPAFYKVLYNNRIAYYQSPSKFGSVLRFSTRIINAFITRVKVFPGAIFP